MLKLALWYRILHTIAWVLAPEPEQAYVIFGEHSDVTS